ncbi:MAG: tRNA (guanosine(46)-N7)-methyltransferase TrmB [Phycisphaeraceae bacterium]|nr:tRNA (guanosine(46)-N7)-methyltransferase TrmB [Phycisphaeraceae bacterium]
MSFGLARGRQLDVTGVGLTLDDLPPLPDSVLEDPPSAWIDPRAWFPCPDHPFELEIGSGKGAFLVQTAGERPGVNYLGIEYAHEFYEYTADRIRRHALTNIRVLNADASAFVQFRVPSAIVDVLHLYFPDPWPKSRHHKRRMIQDSFLEQAHRIIRPGGELRIVTDHPDYWAWMEAHFDRWCAPDRQGARFDREPFTEAHTAGESGELVGSNFERKYRREGRPFHAAVLRKPM